MYVSGRKGARWICRQCGKGCAKEYKHWKPTHIKMFQRGQVDPNRPNCVVCEHPMSRDKLNPDGSVHYRCHRCEKAGLRVTRLRQMPTEAELVFCVTHHTRMYRSNGSGGHPCYSCRACHITIRKYQAPKYSKRLKQGFILPTIQEPFTLSRSEMLGASCLNCYNPLTLTTKKHAHSTELADAYCCRHRKCSFIIVAFKKSRFIPRRLQINELFGASCIECKTKMTLRSQRRLTKKTPTFSLLWHCDECGACLMVEYINHSRKNQPKPKPINWGERRAQRYTAKIVPINAQTRYPGVRRVPILIRWLEQHRIRRGDTALVAMGTKVRIGELGYFAIYMTKKPDAAGGYTYKQLAFACRQDKKCHDLWHNGARKPTDLCLRQNRKKCVGRHRAKLYGRVIGIARKREQVNTKLKFRLPKLRFTQDGNLSSVTRTGIGKRPAAKVPGINDALFLEAVDKVERIVRKDLPALFRDDICQAILIDVWERRVKVLELNPALATLYVAEQNRFFGNKKKMLSLETHVGDEDSKIHLGDTLEAADPGESSLTRAIRRKQLE